MHRERPRHRAACTSSFPTIPSCRSSPRVGVGLRDLRKPPPDLNVPDRSEPGARCEVVLAVGSDCAIGKMTVALELDAEARRLGPQASSCQRDRRGSRSPAGGCRSTRSSRTSSSGRRRSSWSKASSQGGKVLWVEGQGLASPSRLLGRQLGLVHGAARMPTCSVTSPARSSSTTTSGSRCRRSPSSSTCTNGSRYEARPARVVGVALNTRLLDDAQARAAVVAARGDGPAGRRSRALRIRVASRKGA